MHRKVANVSALSIQPCGGTSKGFVHFVTTPGSKNYIAWKVVHPSQSGNCTLRMGQGADEDDFFVLHPLDKSGDKYGSFPCGREETGVEGKEIKIPSNITCDQCVIQFEWKTEIG